jgi:uncharacterized membrane protein/protein-disulfide isomerase
MQYVVPPKTVDKPPLGVVTLWFLRLLAVIALGCSLFLSWRSIQTGPIPGCGDTTWDCDHIVTSEWSRWLGIPVSYLGAGTYACLLAGLLLLKPSVPQNDDARKRQNLAWTLLVPLFVAAALSGLWFTYVQASKIGKYCPYCLATHACGLVISAFLTYGVVRHLRGIRNALNTANGSAKWLLTCVGVGFCAAASLVLGQHFFPHDTFVVEDSAGDPVATAAGDSEFSAPGLKLESRFAEDESGNDDTLLVAPGVEAESTVLGSNYSAAEDASSTLTDDLADIGPASIVVEKPILTGRKRLYFYPQADPINVYEYPILGNPDAENLIVEVVDYTCHHCRKMYHHVEAARAYFGDRLAVVVRPVALDQNCNPYITNRLPTHKNACKYVRLALAVWSTAPDKFPEFHNWLMGPENVPELSTASSFAAELIGVEELRAAVKDTEILGMLGENHRLWNRIGGNLPLIFAGQRLIRGMPRDDDHFIETLSAQFGNSR